MPIPTKAFDPQELFWLSIMAGGAKLHGGDLKKINRDMVCAALDPYRAYDERELPKRYFHVPGHAEEITERIDGRMHNVHLSVRSYITQNRNTLSQKPYDAIADELGEVYLSALNSSINNLLRAESVEQERRNLADTDFAALWHDTVYHSDVQLPRASEQMLCSRYLKRNGERYDWTEEGKKCFSYQLLSKLDQDGKEMFLGPFMASRLGMRHNEILSAIMCESALHEMGIKDPQHIIGQVAVIVNTIPFRSPEYQKLFEKSVAELCAANPGPDNIVKSGKIFTNLADVADFGMEMRPGNLNILVGLTQVDRELIPCLRQRDMITGLDKATIDRSPFLGKFLAPNVASGKREIFRGDGQEGSELAQLRNRGHANAIQQLKAGCLLEDARVVAGLLTYAVMHEAGINKPEPQANITHRGQVVELFNCTSSVKEFAGMDDKAREMADIVCDVLSRPNNTKRLNGAEVEYGMPGDEYAAALIKAVGPETVGKMAEKVYRVVSHRKSGDSPHDSIMKSEKPLMNAFSHQVGDEDFRKLKRSLSQAIYSAVAHPDIMNHAVSILMNRYNLQQDAAHSAPASGAPAALANVQHSR